MLVALIWSSATLIIIHQVSQHCIFWRTVASEVSVVVQLELPEYMFLENFTKISLFLYTYFSPPPQHLPLILLQGKKHTFLKLLSHAETQFTY